MLNEGVEESAMKGLHQGWRAKSSEVRAACVHDRLKWIMVARRVHYVLEAAENSAMMYVPAWWRTFAGSAGAAQLGVGEPTHNEHVLTTARVFVVGDSCEELRQALK